MPWHDHGTQQPHPETSGTTSAIQCGAGPCMLREADQSLLYSGALRLSNGAKSCKKPAPRPGRCSRPLLDPAASESCRSSPGNAALLHLAAGSSSPGWGFLVPKLSAWWAGRLSGGLELQLPPPVRQGRHDLEGRALLQTQKMNAQQRPSQGLVRTG